LIISVSSTEGLKANKGEMTSNMIAKFELNRELFRKYEKDITSSLYSQGIEESTYADIILSTVDWVEKIDDDVLKALVTEMDKYDTILDVTLIDSTDVKFTSSDSMKKLFLINLSSEWESSITVQSAVNALLAIEQKEIEFGKLSINFSEEEITESMSHLLGDMRYHRLRNRINIISKMQKFYEKYITIDARWEEFKGQKEISRILGQEFQEYVLTRKDLIDLSKIMANVQDTVIPILLFEGVRLSKIDDFDELRYLKKSDFKGNKLVIRGNGSMAPREISIDREVGDVIQEAIEQEMLIKVSKFQPFLKPLEDTDYIIRKTVSSRARKDTSYEDDVMSFRGAYSRIVSCRSQLEALLYDIPFSPQSISTAGKVYYVNRYIAEGLDVYDALRKTLVRFGVWYGDPEADKKDPKNRQLINRLKDVWLVHKEK